MLHDTLMMMVLLMILFIDDDTLIILGETERSNRSIRLVPNSCVELSAFNDEVFVVGGDDATFDSD